MRILFVACHPFSTDLRCGHASSGDPCPSVPGV